MQLLSAVRLEPISAKFLLDTVAQLHTVHTVYEVQFPVEAKVTFLYKKRIVQKLI